jgi:16S rRNA C967 or C1407 C5-methylase (RsmB/RsmF family)
VYQEKEGIFGGILSQELAVWHILDVSESTRLPCGSCRAGRAIAYSIKPATKHKTAILTPPTFQLSSLLYPILFVLKEGVVVSWKGVHTNSIPGTMAEKLASFHEPPMTQLSRPLREFYDSHHVAITTLMVPAPSNDASSVNPFCYRFVRLNPRYEVEDTLNLLKEELKGVDPIHVPWLPEDTFYALPADFALSSSACFQSGRLYGMDVSSGAAVSALLSDTYNKTSLSSHSNAKEDGRAVRVLDLCCCPGLKLCAIADRVPSGSTVVGVDVSEHRMALCNKIVRKYHIENSTSGRQDAPASSSLSNVRIQLYCQDGTTFGTSGQDHALVFDSRVAVEEESTRGSRKRKNKSARARERKRLKQIVAEECISGQNNCDDQKISTSTVDQDNSTVRAADSTQTGSIPPMALFDHVLVDAECSTDGSLKHLRESLNGATESSPQIANLLLTDKGKLAELLDLQRRLLASGYRLLKPGGTLVYSTCSLSHDQNEKIVQWLLDECGDAYLIPVQFASANSSKLVVEGSLGGTIRFFPNLTQDVDALFGDGFFLAKIGKREQTIE